MAVTSTKVKRAAPNTPPAPPLRPRRISRQTLLGAAVIAIATIIVYIPAIRGGMIWDDPEHLTNNDTLRDVSGLVDMWTRPKSLPQWYPLVHTTFWIEFHLWKLHPLGYHLDNVILHIISCLLLWRLLYVLKVPGAWLAAAIFALHPVEVESVAWITERKNVLSGMFYFLSLLTYLKWDGIAVGERVSGGVGEGEIGHRSLSPPLPVSHSPPHLYWLSLALFTAALLSKSVTATLPAAILVIIWWKRGTIRLRQDVLPLIPFFVLGIVAGLHTAYLERTHVGATGERLVELKTSFLERALVAGRIIWFYAGKIVWPHPQSFIYPRWEVNVHSPAQWLFPIGVLAVLVTLLLVRKQTGRAPLAVMFLFCGTLFPVLSFLNVYPMRFSFVADHFQYLASVVLISAIAAILCRSVGVWGRVVLVPLAVVTALRTPVYHSAETLWTDTEAKNPNSWMVRVNRGNVLVARGQESKDPREREECFDEAEREFVKAVELGPEIYDTHTNLGMALGRRGLDAEALAEFDKTLKLNPNFAPAYYGIGRVYFRQGKLDEAIEKFRKAVEIAPLYPEANYQLGSALEQQGKLAEAAPFLRVAVGTMPEDFEPRFTLGSVLVRLGQYDEAMFNLKDAVRIRPDAANAWLLLGVAQLKTGHQTEAFESAHRAQELDPKLRPPPSGSGQAPPGR
jgi:Flp pilus assembly protein TadD